MAERGRPRSFDRDQALAAAMRLFWRQGYAATSMAELCAAMGIGSPSLYAAFGSKEALYAEALRLYGDSFGPLIWGEFDQAPTARAAVAGLLEASARVLPRPDCGGLQGDQPGGCMVTLGATGEVPGGRLPALLLASRGEGLQRMRARLEAALAAGELPPGTDTAGLARCFIGFQQGMSVQARDGASQAELQAMARAAMAAWPPAAAP